MQQMITHSDNNSRKYYWGWQWCKKSWLKMTMLGCKEWLSKKTMMQEMITKGNNDARNDY